MSKIKLVTFILLLSLPQLLQSQYSDYKLSILKQNKQLYTSFNKFYTDSIRNETKDEWGEPYFKKIDQINGVHYFDYNEDGKKDALVEFSARNSDGGTFYFLVAVLFENIEKKYIYKAHFQPENRLFEEFSQPFFIFSGSTDRFSKEITTKKYKLLNNSFMENHP